MEGGGKKHNLKLTLHDYSYLIAIVSCLDTRMKKLHALAKKRLDRVLTFEQMAVCCQHSWVLRGNFQSGNERKYYFALATRDKGFVQFPTISQVTRDSDRKKIALSVFQILISFL